MEKIKHIPNHQPDDVADQKNDWKILEDFIGCLDCLLLEENTKASPRIFGRKNILIWLKKPHHIPENSISWDDHPQVLSQHVSIITSNHSGAPETDLKLAWSAVKRTEFHNSSRKNTPITEGKKTRCRKKQVGKSGPQKHRYTWEAWHYNEPPTSVWRLHGFQYYIQWPKKMDDYRRDYQ